MKEWAPTGGGIMTFGLRQASEFQTMRKNYKYAAVAVFAVVMLFFVFSRSVQQKSDSFTAGTAGQKQFFQVNPAEEIKNGETTVVKKNPGEPVSSAESFISVFVDKNGGEKILAEKNKDEQLPIASITKLMTALVASGIYKPNDIISVSEKSLGPKAVSGVYKEGEKLLFSDALHAMLIASHNEVADAVAGQFGREKFVSAMNEKAKEMRLSDTQFSNAIGLDPADRVNFNHSTAFDLYKLLKFVYVNYPEIVSITSLDEFQLNDAEGNSIANITSTDRLLGMPNIPFQILGGKTGETPLAKQNLAIITEAPCRGKLFSAVLHSDNSFGDMEKLLEYDKDSYVWKCVPAE